MRYVIEKKNWGVQAGNAITMARNGDEIVVPDDTVEKFVKSIIVHNRPDLVVTVTVKEQNE